MGGAAVGVILLLIGTVWAVIAIRGKSPQPPAGAAAAPAKARDEEGDRDQRLWGNLAKQVDQRPGANPAKPPPRKPILPGPDGRITLPAPAAILRGTLLLDTSAPRGGAIVHWSSPGDCGQWEFTVAKAGDFAVFVTASAPRAAAAFTVTIDKQTIPGKADRTGDFKVYRPFRLGTAHLVKPGSYRLEIRPVNPWVPVNLLDVKLLPLPPGAR